MEQDPGNASLLARQRQREGMMTDYADKTRQNTAQSVEDPAYQKARTSAAGVPDNRPEALAQRKFLESSHRSPRALQLKSYQRMANNSPQGQQAAQLHAMLKSKTVAPVQRKPAGREEEDMAPAIAAAGAQPVQMVRIKLDHGNDPIMNNVRAASVPHAGAGVDGLNNYHPAPNAQPIGIDENITLEGHGTYLAANHAPNAPYDSQAYLGPRQLANVAALVPKPPQWKGHIILFGCGTGPLTAGVSGHYRALTGNAVNVVGTLADIRMEVPVQGGRNYHRAEYDPQHGGALPRAPVGSVSGRTRYVRWLRGARAGATAASRVIALGREGGAFDGNEEARDRLRADLSQPLAQFVTAHTERVNYQGGTRSGSDIAHAREMIHTAQAELAVFILRLADPQDGLDDKATELDMFFEQLARDFDTFERQAAADAAAVPNDVVDWEGENVINSMASAQDAAALPGAALPRHALSSDQWGGGVGGQVLMHEMVMQPQNDNNELV
jgi:hypothetical protein